MIDVVVDAREAAVQPFASPKARVAAVVAVVLALLSVGAGTAHAAPEPVTGFGSNPGALAMYVHVPDELAPSPAVVVALHGCTQSAADYDARSGWPAAADRAGFVVVYPEQRQANNANRCFNWFQPGDTARDSGEALSVRQMVDTAVARYGADPGRVYVTGLSAGGAMTAALLAAYPDVFAGGAVVAGIPAGCADDLIEAFTCQNPGVDRTPAQWAAAVRSAAPGFAGPYPRVAIWHGTSDTIVVPRNADESRDQWTAVHGLASTPTATETLPGRNPTVRETYDDADGRTLVEVDRVQGIGHGTPVDPAAGCGTAGAFFLDAICSTDRIAEFWGL